MSTSTPIYARALQWAIFTDTGKATLSHGDTITKVVSNWRKDKSAGRGEVVGVIRCGWAESAMVGLKGTDVFSVICCLHSPENGAAT